MFQLPNEPPAELLHAIGRFIVMWSTVETQLALQVGRLVAAEPDHEAQKMVFNAQAFLYSSSVARGSNARALLAQIGNLAFGKTERVNKVAATILKIKAKRDHVAHLAPIPIEGELVFHGHLTASKQNLGANYPYTAEKIHGWTAKLREAAREIDSIVNEYTDVSWAALQEANTRWGEAHQEAARQVAQQLNRQDGAPPATPEEEPPLCPPPEK